MTQEDHTTFRIEKKEVRPRRTRNEKVVSQKQSKAKKKKKSVHKGVAIHVLNA